MLFLYIIWTKCETPTNRKLQHDNSTITSSSMYTFDINKVDYSISLKNLECQFMLPPIDGINALDIACIKYVSAIDFPLLIRLFDNGRVDSVGILSMIEPKWNKSSKLFHKQLNQLDIIVPTELLDSFLIPQFNTKESRKSALKGYILSDCRYFDYIYIIYHKLELPCLL